MQTRDAERLYKLPFMGQKLTASFFGFLLFLSVSVSSLFGQTQVNILWIGNSLTTGNFGCGQGWHAPAYMNNPNSDETGIILAMKDAMAGATRLATHWSNESGFSLMDNPVVWNPDDIWQNQDADSYDYLVLQPYSCHDASSIASERQALINYCDLAVSKGIKPVLFACWESPDVYDAVMAMYLEVWNTYKDQGALMAPLFDAHRLVLETENTAYLYGGDTWEHHTPVAAYMHSLIFQYLFTDVSPTEYDLGILQGAAWPYSCTVPSEVVTDADFLATEA
ncbi:secreted protein, partial [sediment metagenome]